MWSPAMVISSDREDDQVMRVDVVGQTDRWSRRVPWPCEIAGARCSFQMLSSWFFYAICRSIVCRKCCRFCVGDDVFAILCAISGITLYQVKFKLKVCSQKCRPLLRHFENKVNKDLNLYSCPVRIEK